VLRELDGVGACVVLYRRDLREGLPDPLFEEPVEGVALNLDEIR
jgi:hypothetical protein